jgi:3'-5' exoribonuclease
LIPPEQDSVVQVNGQIIKNGDELIFWVRELVSATINTEICALELAIPNWVEDQKIIDSLSDIWNTLSEPFREIINAVFYDPIILRGFLQCPGSIRHHDAFTGGCIFHTVQVAKMARTICELVPNLDRDLLVAGAILHDIGKSSEYEVNNYGRWRMSNRGIQVGHKVNGAIIVAEAAKKCKLISPAQIDALLNMLTASYAPAWGGYRLPKSPEAEALASIDNLCAKSAMKH